MPKELAVQYFKTDKTKARKFESFLERQIEKGLTFGFEVRRRERQGLMFSVELVVGEKQILKLIEKFASEVCNHVTFEQLQISQRNRLVVLLSDPAIC